MTEELSEQTKRFHAMWNDELGWNTKRVERLEKVREYNRAKKSGGKQKVTMKPITVGRNAE